MNPPEARIISKRAALVLPALLLALLCALLRSVSGNTSPSPCPDEEASVVRAIHPEPPYRKVDYLFPVSSVRNPRVYIYKGRRRLLVLTGDVLIRDYPIGLGPRPAGDKQKRGDGRTPEGEFFVCVKNPRSKYHKSLGLSYPGEKHAYQALLSGLLSYRKYEAILRAQERKKRPPWNTPLGGDICIHGAGAHEDWTRGCVALYNYDMDELFEIVTMGTPVVISP